MKNNINNSKSTLSVLQKFFLLSGPLKLFLLLIIIPVLMFICFYVSTLLVFFFSESALVFDKLLSVLFISIPILELLFVMIFLGWFYILGTSLYSKIPRNLNFRINFFKFNLFYLLVLILSFIAVFLIVFTGNFEIINKIQNIGLFMIMYGVFSSLYLNYFISKALVTVEKQDSVKFENYFLEIMFFMIFPVGIWILQPRIRKIFQIKDNNDN